MFTILILLSFASSQDSDLSTLLRLFQKEDKDQDGILTSAQFIQGLVSAFINQGVEKDHDLINSFGREFLGRKKTRGSVRLDAIEAWLQREELQQGYADWKHVKDEGEGHHHRAHKHRKARFNSKVVN